MADGCQLELAFEVYLSRVVYYLIRRQSSVHLPRTTEYETWDTADRWQLGRQKTLWHVAVAKQQQEGVTQRPRDDILTELLVPALAVYYRLIPSLALMV